MGVVNIQKQLRHLIINFLDHCVRSAYGLRARPVSEEARDGRLGVPQAIGDCLESLLQSKLSLGSRQAQAAIGPAGPAVRGRCEPLPHAA